MPNEWVEWHRGYEGDHPHARRLRLVQERIREALDAAPPGGIRLLSMCAGDGRDLLGVLPGHARRNDVRANLVDLTPELVASGRATASREGLTQVEFMVGDAGTTTAYSGAVPADILLVCGVFGNITDDDVRTTIEHLSELSAPGATVIWTRGRFEPDLTPAIREWFSTAGFSERSFVAIPETTASVGVHRLVATPRSYQSGVRLFSFLPKEERPSARRSTPVPGAAPVLGP